MNTTTPQVAIIGAGLIGGKRAAAIRDTGMGNVAVVSDTDAARAQSLADAYHAEATVDWRAAVARDDIDVVVVAVPNTYAKDIVLASLEAGKHILCEKPFGKNAQEAAIMKAAADAKNLRVKVGFNHRFHPAVFKAHEAVQEGKIGKVLFVRAKYGHGGRLGMEKEWRADPSISGGGELLDQGVHVIDLSRWFAGEFTEIYGIAETKFWNMPVDDNAFSLMRGNGVTAMFHVSTTNWKNTFLFEVFGDKGFVIVDGIGRSYGKETLIIGKRKEEFGVPETETIVFDEDSSWNEEWKNFIGALQGNNPMIGDDEDGLQANRIVQAIYESSKKNAPVSLSPFDIRN